MFDYLLLPLVCFVSTLIADVVWAHWCLSVQERNPHRAALCSVGIILCGSVLTWVIVERNLAAYIAGLVGAYLGTWWAVYSGGK